ADHFNYMYQSASGDLTITARVATQQNTNAWAKAALMFRESTAANAADVFVFVTPGQGVNMEYRSATGATSVQLAAQAGLVAPYWIRLVRAGNTFTGFSSANGTAWTQVGTIDVTMAAAVKVGLAVTAHNDTAPNAA